jgi:dienelactone hydrolase
MKYMQWIGLITVAASTAFVMPAGAASHGTVIRFSSLDKSHPLMVSGTLYMPDDRSSPCPAVVVVHGTGGIDSRGAFYRTSILKAGIAFFEVDFKTGIYTGTMDRPSPQTFVPLGFAALKELRKLPAIDPGRIAIMGFSMGGHLTVNEAFEANRQKWMGSERGFVAHVGLYPVCKSFLTQSDCRMTGAPMIILYGTEDAYGEGKSVPAFKSLLLNRYNFEVTTVEYPGATHAFDRDGPSVHYADPAAIGGRGYMAWDANAAKDSLARVVDFLKKNLTAK